MAETGENVPPSQAPPEKPATPGLSRLSSSSSRPQEGSAPDARRATPTPPPGAARGDVSTPAAQNSHFSRLRSVSRRPSTTPGPVGGESEETAGDNGVNERPTRPQRPFIVPQLTQLCVNTISAHFERQPTFGKMPDKYVKQVTKQLALDLPLEVAGQVCISGSRCCCISFGN